MSGLTSLGMTDVASRSRGKQVWWSCLLIFTAFVAYMALRNFYYIQGGMFEPDFGLIQKAYDFNLKELPILLFLVSLLYWGLSLSWAGLRRQLRISALLFLFLSVDLWMLRYYVTHVEPERLVVRRIRLETPKLQEPVRLLHISDIQAGAVGPYQRKIFEKIQELEPDIILNTGDYLQIVPPATFKEELPKLIHLIGEANPAFGTYGVFGDTELELYRVPSEELKPLQLLSSRSTVIDLGSGKLSLHGLSLFQSKNYEWAERTITDWLKQSEEDEFRILMGHSPNYAMGVSELPIDLCLAGHTHGGQVRLPFIGPLTTYSEVPDEWARGFRRVGIPYLNVSAGAGSNRRHGLPPIRFNCPTEMTLIELIPVRSLR